jgi:hypothetical protein
MPIGAAGQRIKSIQTVLVTIPVGNTQGTATIASVSTTKTLVEHCGQASPDSNASYALARLSLTSATQVTAQRNGTGGGAMNALEVQAQVIEYE